MLRRVLDVLAETPRLTSINNGLRAAELELHDIKVNQRRLVPLDIDPWKPRPQRTDLGALETELRSGGERTNADRRCAPVRDWLSVRETGAVYGCVGLRHRAAGPKGGSRTRRATSATRGTAFGPADLWGARTQASPRCGRRTQEPRRRRRPANGGPARSTSASRLEPESRDRAVDLDQL